MNAKSRFESLNIKYSFLIYCSLGFSLRHEIQTQKVNRCRLDIPHSDLSYLIWRQIRPLHFTFPILFLFIIKFDFVG